MAKGKYQLASTFKTCGAGEGRQVAFRALSHPKSTGLQGVNGVGDHHPPGILQTGNSYVLGRIRP